MTTCKCGKEHKLTNKEGLCKKCFTSLREAEWLDNTNIFSLGIIKWCREFLPEHMPNVTPLFHLQIYLALLRAFLPIYLTKLERLFLIISWRGSAKSTIATFFAVMYVLTHNGKVMKVRFKDKDYDCRINESFICIVSDTGPMAEDFIMRCRNEFDSNKKLKYYYQDSIQNAYDELDNEWTKRAFKYGKCHLLGIGQGAQVRGRIKGTSRITWLIADDIYSENNVLTEETRRKIRNWWNKAVENSVDDVRGKITMVNTIVHNDTVTVDAKNNDQWKVVEFSLMPVELFKEFLAKYVKIDHDRDRVVLPFDEIEDTEEKMFKQRDFFKAVQDERDWQLSWGDRFGLYQIALKYKKNYKDGVIDSFYQEYFHIVQSDETKRFTKRMMRPSGHFKIFKRHGLVWIEWDKYPKPQRINVQFGVDIADFKDKSDNCVITISGMLPDRTGLIIKQVAGKMSARDHYKEGFDSNIDGVTFNREVIQRMGYISESYRLSQLYYPQYIRIGRGGDEGTIIDEFSRVFMALGSDAIVLPRDQNRKEGAKHERIFMNLHPRYQGMSMYHAEGLEELELELELLGSAKKDDRADSAECSFYGIQVPEDDDFNYYQTVPELNMLEKQYIWSRHLKTEKRDWRLP
jgi:hypothetical protein